MLCKECMSKNDFSIKLPLEIDKIATLEELIMGKDEACELTSEALYGIGVILGEVCGSLWKINNALYEKEENDGG